MILNVTGNHISKTFQYLLYEFQLLFDLLLDIQCSLIYLWVTKKGRKSKIWKGISCNKRHGEEERITSIIRNGINQKREKKKNETSNGDAYQQNENRNLYFWWWWARFSAWYLVLQVSSGYRTVVLTSAPTAPDVASTNDSISNSIEELQPFHTTKNKRTDKSEHHGTPVNDAMPFSTVLEVHRSSKTIRQNKSGRREVKKP